MSYIGKGKPFKTFLQWYVSMSLILHWTENDNEISREVIHNPGLKFPMEKKYYYLIHVGYTYICVAIYRFFIEVRYKI